MEDRRSSVAKLIACSAPSSPPHPHRHERAHCGQAGRAARRHVRSHRLGMPCESRQFLISLVYCWLGSVMNRFPLTLSRGTLSAWDATRRVYASKSNRTPVDCVRTYRQALIWRSPFEGTTAPAGSVHVASTRPAPLRIDTGAPARMSCHGVPVRPAHDPGDEELRRPGSVIVMLPSHRAMLLSPSSSQLDVAHAVRQPASAIAANSDPTVLMIGKTIRARLNVLNKLAVTNGLQQGLVDREMTGPRQMRARSGMGGWAKGKQWIATVVVVQASR